MKIKINTFTNIVCNALIFILLCSIIIYTVGDTLIPSMAERDGKPIYRGNEEKPQVTLMVNVYWGTEYIEPMLELFDEYDCNTTFFVGGMWAVKESQLLEQIANHGHEIANHGYSHKDMATMSVEACNKEIENTNAIIESVVGKRATLFAPPSGSFSKSTLQSADSLSMNVIMWSRDTIDWRDKNADLIFKRATNDIKNGELILMHPTEMTLKALPRILQYYKENNIKVVTVTNNIME